MPGQNEKSHADARIKERRIVAKDGRTPNPFGIVIRDVDHLRIGRLNHDCRLPVLSLRCHSLLGCRHQLPVGLRLGAHILDGMHDVGLLR
jgi:hypothetical protein